MTQEIVSYDRERMLELIRDLAVLVVSIDRIGSAWHDRVSDEQYNAMFVKFFDDFEFGKKLSNARTFLSEAFPLEVGEDGMDELERGSQDLKYWTEPKD